MVARNETGYVKYLTDEEFKVISNHVSGLRSPSLKLCLRVMMFLGLRVGEAVKLKRENFSLDFSKLTYRPLKCRARKSKIKERVVPDFLRNDLLAYVDKYACRMRDGFLFFASYANNSLNLHLQRSTVSCFFRDLRCKKGLNHVYFVCKDGKRLYRISAHTLRHYAIWRYYKASGNDLLAACQMIGHENSETTARYINALECYNREGEIIEHAFDL